MEEKIYEHRFNYLNGIFSTNIKVTSKKVTDMYEDKTIKSGEMNDGDLALLQIDDWINKISLKEIIYECDKLYNLEEKRGNGFAIDICYQARKVVWDCHNIKIEKKSIIRLSVNRSKKDHSFVDIPLRNDKNEIINDIEKAYKEIAYSREKQQVVFDYCNAEVIMTPKAAGYFIHEIVGHPLESDIVDSLQSFYSKKDLGTNIMPQFINIIENPLGLKCVGYDFGEFDDEGNELKLVELIKNGKLINFIQYKRCENLNYPCLNRMHNLVLLPQPNGKGLQEIINSSNLAIVIDEIIHGGFNVHTNEFILLCGKFRYVKNGKIVGTDEGILLKDDISTLKNKIVEVGNDFKQSIGLCTKQMQTITVGIGAPTIRLHNMNIQKDGWL